MIGRLIDKLVFALALLVALQIPLLVDHYHQYLSGLYKATQWQVEGYEATAKANQFVDAKAMIEQHLRNTEPSVRADAEQKQKTIQELNELSSGIATFTHGSLLEKIWFMFQPARIQLLKDVVQNFKVGIPLSASGLLFSLVLAFILNFVILLPFWILGFGRRSHKQLA